jgi:hypothetical protein
MAVENMEGGVEAAGGNVRKPALLKTKGASPGSTIFIRNL